MRKIASGVFAAFLAASCLTGCFELTSPEEEAKLVSSTPFKDFSRLRLVNQSGTSAEKLENEKKCPGLLRLRSHNTYQIYDCTGKSSKFYQAFSSAQFPNVHVFRECEEKDKDSYKCESKYYTLKKEGDMAIIYSLDTSGEARDAYYRYLKDNRVSGAEGPIEQQRLDRLGLRRNDSDSKSGNKGPDKLRVGTADDLFFLANLTANDSNFKTEAVIYAIE